MSATAEHLGTTPGNAPVCPAGCDHLDKYLSGPICTQHEVRLRLDPTRRPLRCMDCVLDEAEGAA